jgi:hypothetical protein
MDATHYIPNSLVGVGHEIVATKRLSIGCATVLFYEYILTFSDEVQYAWQGKKTWVSLLFFMNRYLPIAYKIWDLCNTGQYLATQLVTWDTEQIMTYCAVATFTENSYLVLVTMFSQLFLAVRVYAVRGRSKASFAILATLTLLQFTYGVVYIALFRRKAYTYVSVVSPQRYTFASCLQEHHDTDLQLGYLGISLAFDIVAFLMIAICSYKSSVMYGASGLFDRLVQDATVYFLVIVWVHLTVTIFTSRMGDSRILRVFPAFTNIIIPVMICRLVLSLKKATDPNVIRAWNVDHFSTQLDTLSPIDVPMTPISFHSPTITTSDRGLDPRRNGSMVQIVNGSSPDNGPCSHRWAVDGPEERSGNCGDP